MVAVPDTGLSSPPDVAPMVEPEPAQRRAVAVSVTAMELLRPDSDLLRLVAGAGYVDLLLACEDELVAPRPLGVLGEADDPSDGGWDDDWDDDGWATDEPTDEVRAAADALGLDELHLHRLGLRPPLGPAAEADLVAALSELVGFDPEPGVYCLAPLPLPGDPARSVVDRAVRRIAQVYGLPLVHYRCLELSVVEDD
jgi:hypothetical protein